MSRYSWFRIGRNLPVIFGCCVLASCGIEKKVSRTAKGVIHSPAFRSAHIGISIYEPASGRYWYDYQGDHYFVPASNIKIPTCYAAMKWLGDSLVSFSYEELPDRIILFPNGDPSFLHPEFSNQPGIAFLKAEGKPIDLHRDAWKETALGAGWSWDDYEETYSAERSVMPLYGNLISVAGSLDSLLVSPGMAVQSVTITGRSANGYVSSLHRSRKGNHITVGGEGSSPVTRHLPMDTDEGGMIARLLADTLQLAVHDIPTTATLTAFPDLGRKKIYSQPTDALLIPMMHRSENFYAEQTLLMVSNRILGIMNDRMVIDALLKSDLGDLPQKPRWVDGSGLSRYNLFTPQDLVAILDKMQREFGMDRIREVFPTGGEGTMTNYYKSDSGYIYGKTGTLSGVVAFSGFLETKKKKQLLFSILINNHNGSATELRNLLEKFLLSLRNRY